MIFFKKFFLTFYLPGQFLSFSERDLSQDIQVLRQILQVKNCPRFFRQGDLTQSMG